MLGLFGHLGGLTVRWVDGFGDFWRFVGQTFSWIAGSTRRWSNISLLMPQLYEIGTRSLPVVLITGLFVGMVLAVQTVQQFMSIGREDMMGLIVNLSVLRELGPVLTAVMLAGRVGGGLTAELGTMRVTEQIDALRAMGTSPIRVLVVPRFLACLLLTPVLVVYANAVGILGGYAISVGVFNVSAAGYMRMATEQIRYFDVFYGLVKSVFFGGALGLICCYKGFRCAAGAAGVGRACTEAFVISCMAILALNLFLGMLLNTIETSLYGFRTIL